MSPSCSAVGRALRTRCFRRARAVGPSVRSSRGRWPGGEVTAAGQLVDRTVYTPSAFRDRLAKGNRGARTHGHSGCRIHNQEGQDGARHCEVVQRRQGLRFHRLEGGPDVFVHVSAIAGSGYRSLEEGQKVEFDITQGQKGPRQTTSGSSADASTGDNSTPRQITPREERTAHIAMGRLIGVSPDELAGHRGYRVRWLRNQSRVSPAATTAASPARSDSRFLLRRPAGMHRPPAAGSDGRH